MPDINYKNLEGFVMLGTHSEPRRGETSHICDISVLRVKPLTVVPLSDIGHFDVLTSFLKRLIFGL